MSRVHWLLDSLLPGLLAVLGLLALHGSAGAQSLDEGRRANVPAPHIFDIKNEAEFAELVKRRLLPGDVIVLPAMRFAGMHMLVQLPPSTSNGKGEPTFIVGRESFERIQRLYGLTRADIETQPEARRLLIDNRINQAPRDSKQAQPTQLDIEPTDLTRLSINKQLRFFSGDWAMAGFDIAANTDRRIMILVDGDAHLVFTGNRLSNCNTDFSACLWQGVDDNGQPVNGGILIHIRTGSAGSQVRGNLFENLRGFILVSIANGSRDVKITDNLFLHIKLWGNNAAEAIHIGAIPIVRSQNEEPKLSRTSALIAYNRFYDYWAEDELIGVKSAGNRIIGNWISDSGGGISMRDGSDTLVEDNLLVRSRSIRVLGDRQTVRRNHIVLPRGFGVWFENGGSRAGYECSGNLVLQVFGPLRWIYRPARDAIVLDNVIEVEGNDKDWGTGIGRRDMKKNCGYDLCDGKPSSIIPCDRNVDDAFLQQTLKRNTIIPLDAESVRRRSVKGLMPGDPGW